MSYLIKQGTIEAVWVGDSKLAPGSAGVLFHGDIPQNPVFDPVLGLREKNAEELLVDAKLTRTGEIDAEWERRKGLGFTFAGKVIDSDPLSRENITNAAITAMIVGPLFSTKPAPGWKCQDNTYLPVDHESMPQMQATMVAAGVALFAYAQTLKAAVELAENPSTVDITAGWPEV